MIAENQAKALSQGNFEDLATLIDQSVNIQAELDLLLAGMHPQKLDQESVQLIQDIQKIHDILVRELQTGCGVMAEKIENLRKNNVLLKGYKQKKSGTPPKFFNKHT